MTRSRGAAMPDIVPRIVTHRAARAALASLAAVEVEFARTSTSEQRGVLRALLVSLRADLEFLALELRQSGQPGEAA